jgi:hypothetical protein
MRIISERERTITGRLRNISERNRTFPGEESTLSDVGMYDVWGQVNSSLGETGNWCIPM